jgi:hypothetical protein
MNIRHLYLPLLIFISLITHFPFVLRGFGELDATKIAVSVIDIINNGPQAAFANFYFTDVVPLYILYLKVAMKLLNYNYSYLPFIMNYTNAVFGTLTVIPAYLLTKKLFKDPTIAFCSVLALIFAPSFYQSTIMGFPHLLALFFLLLSLYFFLAGLDDTMGERIYFYMILSCIFLTIGLLFKSDYVLAVGAYIGFLFIRKEKNKTKIISAFLIIVISGVLFLLLRNLILGHTGGTTMSKEALSRWYNFSISIPRSIDYFIIQTEPIVYGAGVATFCLGIVSIIYFLYKKRFDPLIFILSWAALPTLFWLIMIGNNARHNMISVFPLIVIIIILLYEKFRRAIIILTCLLILVNYFSISPSPSILRPSGNLLKSHALLKERMVRFQNDAKKIARINEDKIAILGYFHNPHVIFEILRSAPQYEAEKIGREDYRIKINGKEYVFIYFVVTELDELLSETKNIMNKYHLDNYTFVSATYDLKPLETLGLKTETVDVIKKSFL